MGKGNRKMTQSKQNQGNSARKAMIWAVLACEVAEKAMLEAAVKCHEAGLGDIAEILEARARQANTDQTSLLSL